MSVENEVKEFIKSNPSKAAVEERLVAGEKAQLQKERAMRTARQIAKDTGMLALEGVGTLAGGAVVGAARAKGYADYVAGAVAITTGAAAYLRMKEPSNETYRLLYSGGLGMGAAYVSGVVEQRMRQSA